MTSRILYSTSGARVGATSSAMLDANPRACAATVTLSGGKMLMVAPVHSPEKGHLRS